MMPKKLQSLQEYFDLLGCETRYVPKLVPCEICGETDFTTVVSHTDAGENILVPVPVASCNSCGFLMQNPRFPDEFYSRYYTEFYPHMRSRSQSNKIGDPNNVGGQSQMDADGKPNDFGFQVALKRAKYLDEYMKNKGFAVTNKSVLDVGSGCGGFMQYFKSLGFHVEGNDPDAKAVEYAKEIGILIEEIEAENMPESGPFGLVLIIGSLEHCKDPNIVLEKCWNMLDDGGIIVVEGRYFPVSESFRWLNSNHHRFLTHESTQAILLKHGFDILLSTTDHVCGIDTGRNGGGFTFAKKTASTKNYRLGSNGVNKQLLKLLRDKGLLVQPEQLIRFIKDHDAKF